MIQDSLPNGAVPSQFDSHQECYFQNGGSIDENPCCKVVIASRKGKGISSRQLTKYERRARKEGGYTHIAGVDEAGRGPLAGPVVAAACIIPPRILLEGVDDSKKINPLHRHELYQRIIANPAILYAVAIVDSQRIDEINIFRAAYEAMVIAVSQLMTRPDYILVDGAFLPNFGIPGEAIVQGDARCQSIAVASIIAKETRDRLMSEMHEKWPEYNFKQNKGYGTEAHRLKLKEIGPCPIHRRSFNWQDEPISIPLDLSPVVE